MRDSTVSPARVPAEDDPVGLWQRTEVLIGGGWQAVESGLWEPVENPATQAHIGTTAIAGRGEVDRAVDAASNAFRTWSVTNMAYRVSVLERLLAELEARRELLVATTVAELGAPVRLVEEDHVGLALTILESYVEIARSFELERVTPRGTHILREAAGVVACITPWNFPLYQIITKVAPALVAGCTVVLKPPEQTPLNAYIFGDAVLAAGCLDGIVNILPGSGPEIGEALVGHPGVDVVSFTGSTAVGRRIGARAAESVKRVCLELGGKSASVVLPDADFARAVRSTVDSAFYNAGQTCSALTRLLVPADREDEAIEIAIAHIETQRVGDPTEQATDIGPLVSSTQRERVEGMLARAQQVGTVVRGSQLMGAVGYFVSPALVTKVSPASEIAQEEVFGPALTVLPYTSDADAVRIANGTKYGLAGAVWSGSTSRARDVAQRLRAGQVSVNGASLPHDAPFGGYGQSGNGRELGEVAIDEFLELKALQI